jgi:type IV secretory pathway VirB3-like protein
MDIETIKLWTTENASKIILITVSITTLIGVILGFTKRAVFYRDYNDLGLSLAVFGVPLSLLLIFQMFHFQSIYPVFFVVIVFIVLLLVTVFKTYTANDGRILPTLIISVSKLVLSFLFILHLFAVEFQRKSPCSCKTIPQLVSN